LNVARREGTPGDGERPGQGSKREVKKISEMDLAHVVRDEAERAHLHSDAFKKRCPKDAVVGEFFQISRSIIKYHLQPIQKT
jgi:hypothetical protein